MVCTKEEVSEFQLAQALLECNRLVGQMCPREIRLEVNLCVADIVSRWIAQQSSTREEADALYDTMCKGGAIGTAEERGRKFFAERRRDC